jgi:4-hydroxybenzoate polyprenyltransferase
MNTLKNSKFYQSIRLLRLHQWFKNILIIAPLFAANIIPKFQIINDYLVSFIALGLCVSSVYIVNDIADYKTDKLHPLKCKRPIASGKISIKESFFLAIILLTIGLTLSLQINKTFFVHILIYLIIANSYSFYLKQLFIVDCLILSFFYTFRIILGSVIINMQISIWLFIFSFSWFLSLALIKRYSELLLFKGEKKEKIIGRTYFVKDISKIRFFGLFSGYLSILILTFYIYSENASLYFNQPSMIWLLILILLIWINFMWIKASKNEINDDPILYALKNKVSIILGIFFLIISILAKWF